MTGFLKKEPKQISQVGSPNPTYQQHGQFFLKEFKSAILCCTHVSAQSAQSTHQNNRMFNKTGNSRNEKKTFVIFLETSLKCFQQNSMKKHTYIICVCAYISLSLFITLAQQNNRMVVYRSQNYSKYFRCLNL